MPRVLKALRLEIGGLVQGEEWIARLRRDAVHDLFDDARTRGVEAENGGR